MNNKAPKLAMLLGSASLMTMAGALPAQAQQQAGPQEIPEQALITGSPIRGTAAVGVPVTTPPSSAMPVSLWPMVMTAACEESWFLI